MKWSNLDLICIIILGIFHIHIPTCVAVSFLAEKTLCGSVTVYPDDRIDLFENGTLSRDDYENIRTGIRTFAVRDSPDCILQICGHSSSIYSTELGACKMYSFRSEAPRLNGGFTVTSISYACTIRTEPSCVNVKCSAPSDLQWEGSQCAILFQEKKCQSCFFFPIVVHDKEWFQSMNSFQIMSLIVRRGCTLYKVTKGFSNVDSKKFRVRDFPSRSVSDEKPAFHKDSENFTCTCQENFGLPAASPEARMIATSSSTLTTEVQTTAPSSWLEVTVTTESILQKNAPSTKVLPDGNELMDVSSSTQPPSWLAYVAVAVFGVALIFVLGGVKRKNCTKPEEMEANVSDIELNELNLELMEDNGRGTEGEVATVEGNIPSKFHEIIANLKRHIEVGIETARKNWEERYLVQQSSQIKNGENKEATLMEQFRLVCSSNLARNSFEIKRKTLGTGHFGIVKYGIFHPPKDHHCFPQGKTGVAVKSLKSSTGTGISSVNSLLREIKIFQVIGSHENILSFIGACCHNGELFILTKFCEKGSLKDYLTGEVRSRIDPRSGVEHPSQSNTGVSYVDNGDNVAQDDREMADLESQDLRTFLEWCEQIASGMDFLNMEKSINHVDLAARNILLSNDLVVQISDFGLSRERVLEEEYANSLLSGKFPVNSIAPECVREIETLELERKITLDFVDVWAYGCTLWEIFNLGRSLSVIHLMNLLARKGLEKPALAPQFVYSKIQECWREKPEERPTFAALKSFFKEKKEEIIIIAI